MTAIKASRRVRRSLGKRRLQRECRRDVVRVLELAEAGHAPKRIAQSVGLGEGLVGDILARADCQRGEGGS